MTEHSKYLNHKFLANKNWEGSEHWFGDKRFAIFRLSNIMQVEVTVYKQKDKQANLSINVNPQPDLTLGDWLNIQADANRLIIEAIERMGF